MTAGGSYDSMALTLLLVVVMTCWASTTANTGALIRSETGQLLTSSTLQWAAVDGTGMPADAVPATDSATNDSRSINAYVCRIRHSGQLHIGSVTGRRGQSGGSCRIVSFGKVVEGLRFEVLVNANGAGRLVWAKWDRSYAYVGAVQVGDHYVGRTDGQLYNVGHLDPNLQQRGRIVTIDQDDVVHESIQGEILLEMEPIEYSLSPLSTPKSRRKVQNSERIQLAQTTLDNMESTAALVTTSLPLTYSLSVYVGQVRGMVKGLPTTLHLLPDDPEVTVGFQWGSASISSPVTQLTDVSHRLEHGTGVNVTVTGHRSTFDGPFTARLTTVYSDQHVGQRTIEGRTRQTVVEDVRVDYGDVYFLANGSVFVPSDSSASTAVVGEVTDDVDLMMRDVQDKVVEPTQSYSSSSTSSSSSLIAFSVNLIIIPLTVLFLV